MTDSTIMPELQVHLEEVDQILQNAQKNMTQLREKMEKDKQMSKSDIRTALISAEQELQQDTEEMATRLDSTARTMPLSNQMVCLMPVLVTGPDTGFYKVMDHASLMSSMLRKPLQPGWKKSLMERSRVTAGQQMSQARLRRSLANPDNALNRVLVQTTYGIQQPLILQRPPPSATSVCKPVIGPTVVPPTIPPRANRLNPQLRLPPIPVEATGRGLYSLIERRWIPSASTIVLKPSPVLKRRIRLHHFDDKFTTPIFENPLVYTWIEENETKEEARPGPCPPFLSVPQTTPRSPVHKKSLALPNRPKRSSKYSRSSSKAQQQGLVIATSVMETAQGEVQQEQEEEGKSFAIRQGDACKSDPIFQAFKLRHFDHWHSITPVMGQLEQLLTKYAVPFAFIVGDSLADLSERCRIGERRPTLKEMLSTMENEREVISILSIPGRQFKGPDGQWLAALKIQTTWRRHRDLADYLQYLQLAQAVRVIEAFFSSHLRKKRIHQQMEHTHAARLDRFRQRAKVFAESWEQIQKSKHVVIHVPSMGFRVSLRQKVTDMGLRQNTQMARLCEIMDPNVDVIYVSANALTEEARHYYRCLLGLAGAVTSGKVDDQEDVTNRYRVIVPDILKTLPCQRMCLSSKLACCPSTLRRLSALIRGRPAYLVTGLPHPDDLALSDALELPILCPEPQVATHYSTKAGSREIFSSADVSLPPGVTDIRQEQQLYESVSHLVLDHLEITSWLFKVNDEFDGRGTACCEVTTHLVCFSWLKAQADHYGYQWDKPWAQETAFHVVIEEIPEILRKHTKLPHLYKHWALFLAEFITQGGVVEAYPDAYDLATLTVNLLLEPGGALSVLMSGDQIHAQSPLHCWGWSVPQSSMEPMVLNDLCHRVARACTQVGIIGYIKIDLLTFVHPRTLEDVVWAVDLYLGYSDSLAMFRLACYLTRGQFQPKTHGFTLAARSTTRKPRSPNVKEAAEETRFFVMSCQLVHTNIALLDFPIFLQLCRAHGIGYDVKGREGTLFTLIDSINRERLGMITIGTSLVNAMATFARQLQTVHEEVSTPSMQGFSNFTGAVEEIENILDTIQQNIQRMKKQEEEKKRSSIDIGDDS